MTTPDPMTTSAHLSRSRAADCPPRIRHAPAVRTGDMGDRVVTVADRVGLHLDPWQAEAVRDALNLDPVSALWTTPRVAMSVPRQNGKGAIIEALEVAFLLGLFPGAQLLIHSAHEFKTSRQAFERLMTYFDTVPALEKARDEKRVKIGVSLAREFVSIDGRTIKFLARSKGSGRGFSADLLILDEAQELPEEVFAAILPTVSARPNAQIWLFGTPPSPEMHGEVFARFRDLGIAGADDRLTYLEWSADPGDDPADPLTWARANPALGIRIREASVRDEFNSMDEEQFARERLGMWDGTASLSVIPEDCWAALASEADPTGRVAFAVDVAPDRSRASIAVAGWLPDGRLSVQVIENRKGTGWVVPRLAELAKRWPYVSITLDSGAAAGALLPDLRRARVKRVRTIATREVAQSCGLFYDLAMGAPGGTDSDGNEVPPVPPRLAHLDQPVLNEAVACARKRALGDAWAWNRAKSSADITPLVSVTFAAFALASKPRRDDSPRTGLVL